MKCLQLVAMAGATVWLVGCASASKLVMLEPVGPAPTGMAEGLSDGSLVIYSARRSADLDVNLATWLENNDFGKNEYLYEPAHTDYTIYARNGEVFQHVRNARDITDDSPAVVTLPPGSYQVEAEAVNCDGSTVKVLMPVLIKRGQNTLARLDGDWNLTGQTSETEIARLPCGRAIGWRAPATELASSVAN